MKQKLMTEIMQQMLPYIDNAQMKQLRQVLEQTLFHFEVTDTELKPEEDNSTDLIDNHEVLGDENPWHMSHERWML